MINRYRDQFKRAVNSFHHQIVFDPVSQTQCCFTPIPPEMHLDDHPYLGVIEYDAELVKELASFQIHPFTRQSINLMIPKEYSHLRFVELRKHNQSKTSLLSYFEVESEQSEKKEKKEKEEIKPRGIKSKYFVNKDNE